APITSARWPAALDGNGVGSSTSPSTRPLRGARDLVTATNPSRDWGASRHGDGVAHNDAVVNRASHGRKPSTSPQCDCPTRPAIFREAQEAGYGAGRESGGR